MVFEVSTARKEIMEKLAERAWTPTALADELNKSRNTVYNHLEALHEQGVLAREKVPAKTRPRTEYNIGDGFMQYLAVLPGQYTERSLHVTPEKRAILRIWNIPQEAFHPYVENYWWNLKHSTDLDYREAINAVAVYGSVARGQADEDSDIDFLVVTETSETGNTVADQYGSVRIEVGDTSKIAMTETYSTNDYRDSVAHGSAFLRNIQNELHTIYDPDGTLRNPGAVSSDEQ